jgi:RNA polymerase sigma factor (sigma-70 family)
VTGQSTDPEESPVTAAALFEVVKAGYQALGELLEQHRAYLRTIIRNEMTPQLLARADASDIVQEANLDVLEHVIRETRGLFVVKQEEDLAAWLRRVCLNALLNKRRDEGRDRRDAGKDRPLAEGVDRPAATPAASSLFRERERNELLERAINRLDEPDRLLLRLRYWHDWSCPQLAALVDGELTEAGRVRMQRRLAELEFRLGEDDEIEKWGQ